MKRYPDEFRIHALLIKTKKQALRLNSENPFIDLTIVFTPSNDFKHVYDDLVERGILVYNDKRNVYMLDDYIAWCPVTLAAIEEIRALASGYSNLRVSSEQHFFQCIQTLHIYWD